MYTVFWGRTERTASTINVNAEPSAVEDTYSASVTLLTGVIYYVDSSKFEGLLPNVMKQLSLFERFYTFVNGVFDLTTIVYDVTVIIFFYSCLYSPLRNGGTIDAKVIFP